MGAWTWTRDIAPDFAAPAHPGERILRLSDFRGQYVVLYFYPRDMTRGCTNEAVQFRDLYDAFRRMRAAIIGVSRDSLSRHARFAEKYALPFPLVSDPEGDIARKYGVWVQKRLYGRTSWGMERATFLIDPAGRIRAVWRKVRVPGHAAEVLQALQMLQESDDLSDGA